MDIEALRAETPGTQHRIHLNNAGAGLMPRPVVDAVYSHLELEATIGGYEAANREADALQGVYGSVARLLNADHDEIALMENATMGWAKAFYSLPFNVGDHILTCRSEYGANYVAYLQIAKRYGVKIKVIANDQTGATDPQALQAMIEDIGAERIRLIAITHVPTNGGLVNPVAEIGAVAREFNILYLLDACQSVGQMPLDVKAVGCDILSAAGRKFLRAPRGTGFLYIRRTVLQNLEPAMIDHFSGVWVEGDRYQLRDDARRFEFWENNYATRMGLGVAVDYALDVGLDAISARATMLADRLRAGLKNMAGVGVYDLGRTPCAIVTFSIPDLDACSVVARLAEHTINASASDANSTRLDAEARNLPVLVRLSPHYYNSEDEIERTLEIIGSMIKNKS